MRAARRATGEDTRKLDQRNMNPKREHREQHRVRLKARRAGIAAVCKADNKDDGFDAEAKQNLIREIDEGMLGIAVASAGGPLHPRNQTLLHALDAQREVVNRMRDAGRLSGELAERLDTELDLDAMGARGEGKRLTDGGD